METQQIALPNMSRGSERQREQNKETSQCVECIWKILRDVLNAAPNYAQAVNIPHYGWMAVLFAVLEPKDTAVYKLIATKPGEAASEG